MHKGILKYSPLILLTLLTAGNLKAQQLAFPGAEGYGRFTTGGRGGEVIEVTNLNDSGPGSLRAAVEASGPRTVVFRVSGNITLESRLEIKHSDITIAGQTAPGDGICLRNRDLKVSASNVIIRYMRFRLGDVDAVEADALGGQSQRNIIIDHCSASWSVDECVSFYNNNENLTLQWCLISESLRYSVHSKGPHGYGGIWGGTNCSFHHNMFAHHSSRNPRFDRADRNIDYRNNVIYNWGFNSVYGGEGGWYNMISNYYKYGPATGPRNRIVEPYQDVAYGGYGLWYVESNYVYGYPEITADNWAGGVQGVEMDRVRVYEPFPYASVVTHTPENAFEVVLADVGASLKRDTLDARIVSEARNGTATYGGVTGPGTGIIDSQDDVGGWPVLNTYDVPVDNDHDGMADDWELEKGLDPYDPSDRNEDLNGDGYTNLEKYLNSLCERTDFLMAPAELEASTISYEMINLKWKENALNESGFSIERSMGDTSAFTEIATVGLDDTVYTDTGLEELTTYHYRVRAFNEFVESGYTNLTKTTTLSVGGQPLHASNPSPADSATDVKINVILTWEAAIGATSYDVYLGTDNPLQFRGNQFTTEHEPRDLLDSTTYYWRVDAVNDSGITTGDVWQFTTESFHDALIAHWPMERGYGSLALDATGNGHYAYLNNMTSTAWVAGRIGKGLQLDGIDDFLLVHNKELINISIRSFTITFWLKQSDVNLTAPWLSKASLDGEGMYRGYEIYNNGEGYVCFVVGDGEHDSILEAPSSSFIADEWVMVTAIRDRSDLSLKLFSDTNLIASVPDSTWNISQNGDLFMSGNAQGNNFLNGVLDEMRIYNYALDTTEIRNLYNEGITGLRPSELVQIPRELELNNYPNPFNSTTLIRYTVTHSGFVYLAVYNLLGQEVFSLVDDNKPTGYYTFRFDAARLPSGIYHCRLNNEGQVRVRKMMLIK
ncbi:MAG: T9SS type A sorting domain-containing protein [Fidelibacterota bacterium]|nr:MAG: T9SS type A sorting domain-containing protein [Candidatus Neomarinimicrobiota bacterium]